ncbi:hypothetical protein ACFOHS_10530 [Jhaorihella thermophila]
MTAPTSGPGKSPLSPLGRGGESDRPRITGIEVAAVLLTLLWLVVATLFLVLSPEDQVAGFFGSAVRHHDAGGFSCRWR